MRILLSSLSFSFMCFAASVATAQPTTTVLFDNVRVLDVVNGVLTPPTNVLVRGNTIERISTTPIPTDRSANTVLVNGGGRTLMPGLIDAHVHMMFTTLPLQVALTADIGFLNVSAVNDAEDMLLRGFTSVRDVGGPVYGLKRGIDAGLVPGPRIWPSGPFVSQSGGHGDFRLPTEIPAVPGQLTYGERVGVTVIADSPDSVRQRVREQLALGASQIKLMAGGGVSSSYDPLDVTQYTVPELRAAVEAAENWGTYVTVHAYTPQAVRQALEAGVKVIEHGQLLDEATVRLMAQGDVWWSLQPFVEDGNSAFAEGSPNRIKQQEMFRGTETAYALAKRFKVKTAWGTDLLFDAGNATRQGSYLALMARWYTPAEVLRMATADNAELLALSGPRNPYPGKLGVIEVGALADLLLVEGNPLENLELVANPATSFVVIVKDGRIYKNSLVAR